MKIWEFAGELDQQSRAVADAHYFSLLSTLASKLEAKKVEKIVEVEAKRIEANYAAIRN